MIDKFLFHVLMLCLTAVSGVTAQTLNNGYEVTREGAWCWFADPRAIHHSNADGTINKSYIGYIDIHGNIKAMQYDFKSKRQQEVLVRSCFQPDDHDNPTFLVLPDDRVMVFYSRHTDERCFYYRISRKPGDLTTLGDEKQIMVENNTTYPSPFILKDDPDHIYLCWRGIKWHPTLARLTMPDAHDNVRIDRGPYQMVQSTGARPYCKYQSDGKNSICLTFTTGHPDNEYPNYLYFSYVDIKTMQLKDISGKVLSNIADGPFKVNKSEEYVKNNPLTVVDNPADRRDWVWQLALSKKNEPVIALVRISEDKKSHDFYYAKWHNGEWRKTFLGNAGGHFHQTPQLEKCYSSGMAIDPNNTNVIYASLPVEGKHGKIYELLKFTLDDNGKILSKQAVTKDSPENNVRPYILPGSEDTPLRLAWMYGKYYDWIVSNSHPLAYNTGIRCDFKGFPTALNLGGNKVKTTLKKAANNMDAVHFSPLEAFTLTAHIDSLPTAFRGILLTVGNLSYSITDGTKPEISINGKTFKGTNRIATTDCWRDYNRGTGGKWYDPSPLTGFELTLSYDRGTLRTYINGMLDQTVEVGQLKVNNAYISNPDGKNKITIRKYRP